MTVFDAIGINISTLSNELYRLNLGLFYEALKYDVMIIMNWW